MPSLAVSLQAKVATVTGRPRCCRRPAGPPVSRTRRCAPQCSTYGREGDMEFVDKYPKPSNLNVEFGPSDPHQDPNLKEVPAGQGKPGSTPTSGLDIDEDNTYDPRSDPDPSEPDAADTTPHPQAWDGRSESAPSPTPSASQQQVSSGRQPDRGTLPLPASGSAEEVSSGAERGGQDTHMGDYAEGGGREGTNAGEAERARGSRRRQDAADMGDYAEGGGRT